MRTELFPAADMRFGSEVFSGNVLHNTYWKPESSIFLSSLFYSRCTFILSLSYLFFSVLFCSALSSLCFTFASIAQDIVRTPVSSLIPVSWFPVPLKYSHYSNRAVIPAPLRTMGFFLSEGSGILLLLLLRWGQNPSRSRVSRGLYYEAGFGR